MKLNTTKLLILAEESARLVGDFLKSYKAEVIQNFGKDIKIDADIKAHKIILESLKKSNIPILSEEDDNHNFNTEDTKWVVDPLDGSINFLRDIPICAVSIGLIKHGEPILGVVYDFNREEIFSGIVGEKAWLNGENISVSNVQNKEEAVIMTGFSSYTDYTKEALEKYISLAQSFKKVRLIGSAALSLAYVASGRADAYYEKDIKIWDVVAGLALVKATGGNYTNIKIDNEGKCFVFANNGYLLAEKFNN